MYHCIVKKMYKTYFQTILIYEAKTRTMTKKDSSRIQGSEMKFLRSMLGKTTRRDRIQNTKIREILKLDKL